MKLLKKIAVISCLVVCCMFSFLGCGNDVEYSDNKYIKSCQEFESEMLLLGTGYREKVDTDAAHLIHAVMPNAKWECDDKTHIVVAHDDNVDIYGTKHKVTIVMAPRSVWKNTSFHYLVYIDNVSVSRLQFFGYAASIFCGENDDSYKLTLIPRKPEEYASFVKDILDCYTKDKDIDYAKYNWPTKRPATSNKSAGKLEEETKDLENYIDSNGLNQIYGEDEYKNIILKTKKERLEYYEKSGVNNPDKIIKALDSGCNYEVSANYRPDDHIEEMYGGVEITINYKVLDEDRMLESARTLERKKFPRGRAIVDPEYNKIYDEYFQSHLIWSAQPEQLKIYPQNVNFTISEMVKILRVLDGGERVRYIDIRSKAGTFMSYYID